MTERLTEAITPAMLTALDRLARAFVSIDGRSSRALVRRGLAKVHGQVDDALLGSFPIVTITDKGRAALARFTEGRG